MTDMHPWAEAWTALSPQRRAALHGRIVDREPVEALAGRLARTVADTEALVASTLVAFRREVVLGIGTGYGEECGSLVLRLVDTAGERLTRSERRALTAHADSCPQCAAAVGALLEMDARLRDGLIALLGGQAPAAVKVPAARTPLVGTPARRRLGLGVGLAVAAVTAGVLLTGTGPDSTPGDLAAEESPVLDTTDIDVADQDGGRDRVVLTGARTAPRTPVAVDAATAAPQAGGGAQGPIAGPSVTQGGQAAGGQTGGGQQPGGNGGGSGGGGGDGGGDPGDPGATPPLDVAVDPATGSVTLTVGLLGDPIVISTPPITKQGRRG